MPEFILHLDFFFGGGVRSRIHGSPRSPFLANSLYSRPWIWSNLNDSFWFVTLLLTNIPNGIALIKIVPEHKSLLKFMNSTCVYFECPMWMLLVKASVVLMYTDPPPLSISYLWIYTQGVVFTDTPAADYLQETHVTGISEYITSPFLYNLLSFSSD
jgi:hypothetical protein